LKISFRKQPFAGLFALALIAPGLAHAADNQTRTVGPQKNGSIVASSNQLLTPAGTTVQLGSPVVVKSVALNPNTKTKTGAVLMMSAAQPIIIFNVVTGEVIQRYVPTAFNASASPPTATNYTGSSFTGLTYSADGSKLFFSQDTNFVQVANVNPMTGELTPYAAVTLPSPPANPNLYNSFSANAAGQAEFDFATQLVALNANNTLGVIDMTATPPALINQIPVGNAPNHVVVKGKYAYVSNEGGRPATSRDFTNLSDGTPIVVDPTNAFATTGTVSVVDVTKGKVKTTIDVGLHPAGMALSGAMLVVANSYSDTLSIIDTATNTVTKTIKVGVPVTGGAFGSGPNDVAIVGGTAYVTLGQSNAIAVVNLGAGENNAVMGYIPTAYFPTGIQYDSAHHQLIVADDKGIGAQGSITSAHGVDGFNTHQETGTVSLIPIPTASQLAAYTAQVISNNNWTSANITDASGGKPTVAPVAIPKKIGEPSLIKHVFLIIKENRTYDQMLGDLPQGNGDPSLAVFASNVPNQHAIVQRFPLLDNVYAPSRQSADGHPWIVESGSFYSNDILSPDWIRSYPGGNSNDALTYTPQGFLWSAAEKKGLNVKMYGEWSAGYTIAAKPGGGSYSWADFYNTSLYNETNGAQGSNIVPANSDTESAAIPSVSAILDPHYPSFNLGIPDQYRADYYIAALKAQDAANAVPNLTIIWLPDDHTNGTTTGYPLPNNYQADNDLALGRMVEAISHTGAWATSAIFVEEDDSQDGVDHIDGHRQPVYVISPYTVAPQTPGVGKVIHTTYTQENINRTIENILDLPPLTQFDLVAYPMFDCFQDTPNLAPFTHVPATTPLNIGPGSMPIAGTGAANYTMNTTPKMTKMQTAWNLASNAMTKGKEGKADAVDENFLNHVIWYSATDWKRPYPGEAKIQWPDALVKAAAAKPVRDDDD